MNRAYLIAEAGVNHGGNIQTAIRMILELNAKADAFKVQVYDPRKLVTASARAYWQGDDETQREFFDRYTGLTQAEYQQIADECHHHGLDFIASVFHVEDVEWLAPLVDKFKIASGDITHLELLDAVAATGKPTILSTGAATLEEITAALNRGFGVIDTKILHCVLCYPTQAADVNLSAITAMKAQLYNNQIGYSDHTIGDESFGVICAAYQLGATTIEKHYTLDKTQPGNDHYHAFEPQDFARLRVMLDAIHAAQGSGGKRVLDCELPAREGARRSLTSAVDIPAGTTITREMVCYMRPGTGLQP